ncbi:MAG: hypothetical protein EAX90_14115 [Candidatus Heimdallarchaeota archaeon]|nr:hypothetical protein [Candidatus Heimdallarchaeota archaeon]
MSKEKTTFPLASIDRLMREYLPDNKIGLSAKVEFDKLLTKVAKLACEKTLAYTNKAKRKTVNAEDVQSAFETIGDTG